ncbi:peptidyl-tRNA hydrolase [Dyella sp. Tek66A03]|uniref:peptidyl-tRNA hydrolase n=1 Tax=Dyella sp. Tek66A03 TaxID=3458298 RepID=UPI00403E9095
MEYLLDEDLVTTLNERKRTMAEFSADYRPLNMYVIYRADLHMSASKLAAQCGHAFVNAYEKAVQERPGITSTYKGTGEGTKIVMYAKSLGSLVRAYRDMQASGLPHHLVIDRGHRMLPHFTGEPIITALGVGPVYRNEVETTMKRYRLAT